MTQGYPLTRIAYGIGVLPIIKDLRGAYPRVTHSWYADDAGAWVSFGNILAHFEDIQVRRTPWGYFLKPTKSILFIAPQNMARAEECFWGIGILLVTGNQYLGGFIGNRDADTTWFGPAGCNRGNLGPVPAPVEWGCHGPPNTLILAL